jgi:hypothetical protein
MHNGTVQSFDVDMYFRAAWRDERLKWQSRPLGVDVSELQVLQDPNKISTIWKPDLYFKNAKSSQTQDIMSPNFAMYIDKLTGIISYSSRYIIKLLCAFFPLKSIRNLTKYGLASMVTFCTG